MNCRLEREAVSSNNQKCKGETHMRYAIVIKKAEQNYSAYVPGLPGCVATAKTIPDLEVEIREAIEFHIDGVREDGLEVPAPSSGVVYIDVAA